MAKLLKLIFQLLQTFFSLTTEEARDYRSSLFSQIHDIVFHGKGGYDWETVYNMPIWLRNFTFKKIEEFYRDEQKRYSNNGKGSGVTTNDINRAKELLQKAQRQDPRNNKNYESPKVNVPDFVTSTSKMPKIPKR